MNDDNREQSKIARTIKTRNDVFEGTSYKKQNNILRMALFYSSCAIVLVLVSYGGLFLEKGHLHDGVLQNDAETMESAINFAKMNRSIMGQMPGILDVVKKDPNDMYSASMNIVDNSPRLEVTTDNLVDILIKSGLLKKTASGLEFADIEWKTQNWAYSHVAVVITSKENPEIHLTLNIAKDGSLLIWRVIGAIMSKALLDKVLA